MRNRNCGFGYIPDRKQFNHDGDRAIVSEFSAEAHRTSHDNPQNLGWPRLSSL